ncbi:MAG: hypothetical protein JKY37_17915 [Nannocystaceae bacterium]|nr:hypothetical protein [Nannocystaceae bacterium]
MVERVQPSRPWLPVGTTLALIGLVLLCDWQKYEHVSISSVYSAHHTSTVRLWVPLATVGALALLLLTRQARRAGVWVVSAVLLMVNTLATARLVMSLQIVPHVAVAGIELDRIELSHNTGLYAHFLCFDRFSHAEHSAEIDSRVLHVPFLPLPVDWSEFDTLAIEMTCVPNPEGS